MDQFEREAPKAKQIQDMKKELPVPYSKNGINQKGEVVLKFSQKIEVPKLFNILQNFY